MIFVDVLKQFFWSMKDHRGRANYLQSFLRNLPGQAGMTLRSNILEKKFRSHGHGLLIQEGVRILNIHTIDVGDNVVIGNGSFLQGAGGIEFGDNVLLGPDVKIWSANHKIDKITKPIIKQGWEYKKVIIEEGCWLGLNVVVLPGVHLPKGCVVSAGSVVVVKRYPAYSLLAGNPARVIGNRQSFS
ncbi:MAG: acyltransferase [Candidatus Electrothrix communis]|nr:MAG: acyltransferase [Candidatus Electrothrix communis]